MRGVLTPFELNRRDLIRELKSRSTLVRRIRTKARQALEAARSSLGGLKIDPTIAAVHEDHFENWRTE